MNQGGTFTNSNSITHVHQDQNAFAFSPIHENHLLNFSPNLLDHDVFLFSSISSLPYQTPTPPPPPGPPPPLPSSSEKEKRKAVVAGLKGSARRTGKKDRHSKIHTAQGPRDRRMRLSLQIARKFFDLQDMLGFDKASKTIDWLFNKSKAAIKDLAEKSCTTTTRFLNTPSSPSEDGGGGVREAKFKKPAMEAKGVPRTKESRAKAREWARERTKEKLLKKKGVKSKEVLQVEQNPNRVIRVDNDNNNHQIMEQHPLEDRMASVGIIEKFLAASSSSSISHFHHDCDDQHRGFASEKMVVRPYGSGVCYEDLPENWATENNARLSNYFVQSPNYKFLSRDYYQGI